MIFLDFGILQKDRTHKTLVKPAEGQNSQNFGQTCRRTELTKLWSNLQKRMKTTTFQQTVVMELIICWMWFGLTNKLLQTLKTFIKPNFNIYISASKTR